MLTIPQVVELYREGLQIRILRRPHRDGLKGQYDPDGLEAKIFLPAIESPRDLDLTLLHEVLHARDQIRAARSPETNQIEDEVEREAQIIYQRTPYVLIFLKWLYHIR